MALSVMKNLANAGLGLAFKCDEFFNGFSTAILVTFFDVMQTMEMSVICSQSPEEIFNRTIRLDVRILASFRATLTVILYMQIFRKLSTRFINTQN